MKVKKVVIEWEEGGETQYTNQTMNEALIHELRLQLAEEKQYLAAARAESDHNFKMFQEETDKYIRLCRKIKDLV